MKTSNKLKLGGMIVALLVLAIVASQMFAMSPVGRTSTLDKVTSDVVTIEGYSGKWYSLPSDYSLFGEWGESSDFRFEFRTGFVNCSQTTQKVCHDDPLTRQTICTNVNIPELCTRWSNFTNYKSSAYTTSTTGKINYLLDETKIYGKVMAFAFNTTTNQVALIGTFPIYLDQDDKEYDFLISTNKVGKACDAWKCLPRVLRNGVYELLGGNTAPQPVKVYWSADNDPRPATKTINPDGTVHQSPAPAPIAPVISFWASLQSLIANMISWLQALVPMMSIQETATPLYVLYSSPISVSGIR